MIKYRLKQRKTVLFCRLAWPNPGPAVPKPYPARPFPWWTTNKITARNHTVQTTQSSKGARKFNPRVQHVSKVCIYLLLAGVSGLTWAAHGPPRVGQGGGWVTNEWVRLFRWYSSPVVFNRKLAGHDGAPVKEWWPVASHASCTLGNSPFFFYPLFPGLGWNLFFLFFLITVH